MSETPLNASLANEMPTVGQLIHSYSQRLLNADNLFAPEASKMRIELVALLATANTELARAEANFKKNKLDYRKLEKTAADTKIYAEADPSYFDYLDRRATRDTILELIRSLRDFTRSLEEERKMTPRGEI